MKPLPPSLTLAKLRLPHGSVPANPLLAEPRYLTKYIERMGTGDMIRRCREAGLAEPGFAVSDGFVTTIWRKVGETAVQPKSRPATGEVTGEVAGEVAGEVTTIQPESQPESLALRVLAMLADEPLSKAQVSSRLGHKEISGQLNKVMRLLLVEDNLEYTLPNKPSSRLQKYRLTDKGNALLADLRKGKTRP